MENLPNGRVIMPYFENWSWQPIKLKKQFGQLTLSDVTLRVGKENDMLNRIESRLNISRYQLICILKTL